VDNYDGVTLDIPDRPEVVRSPTDVLHLVTALAITTGGVILALLYPGVLTSETTDLGAAFDAIPGPVDEITFLILVLAGFGIPIFIIGWFVLQKDLKRVVMVLLAAALAAAGAWLTYGWVAQRAGMVVDTPAEFGPTLLASTPFYPYVAAVTAALTVANPLMQRQWRKVAWASLWIAVILRLTIGSNLPADLIIALGLGWSIGSAILLLFGAPNRAPTGPQIIDALRRSSLDPVELQAASVDARGSTPYFVLTRDGNRLFLKALSTDERSSDLMFRAYRKLLLKNIGDEPAFSTLRRAVEHEALVSMAAERSGVRTPTLQAGARMGEDRYSMFLAFDALDGRSLDSVSDGEITDEVLRSIWEQVGILRSRHIAHRDLRLANVFLDDEGETWIIDFGFSELAATPTMLDTDIAELTSSSSLKVGATRAVQAAIDVIGRDAFCGATPRMQPLALSTATRKALKEADGLHDQVVVATKEACGLDAIDFDSVARFRR
jgi:undecaprenyl-diphosphatase